MKPIYKFNNGNGAMLCNKCRTIISIGNKTEELLCDNCKKKNKQIKLNVYGNNGDSCY